MRSQQQVHLSPISKEKMRHLNYPYQSRIFFVKSDESLSRNGDLNMTQTEHVYAICCRLEVEYNVVSDQNIKTIQGYTVVHFENVSFSSFRDFSQSRGSRRRPRWSERDLQPTGSSWLRHFWWNWRCLAGLRMCKSRVAIFSIFRENLPFM